MLFILIQEAPGSTTPQSANASLDDHERRISHSLYGGLEGLDDNLMPRQGLMPRTIGKGDAVCQGAHLHADIRFLSTRPPLIFLESEKTALSSHLPTRGRRQP